MSISQIAREAKVPYATAWRIINNRPCRSPEAVHAVKAAIARVGYAPGEVRRGRRPKSADGIRTHNIALLHLREGSSISSSVLAHVQRMLGERNLNLIFAHVESAAQLPQAIRAGNVDGILGYGEFPPDAVTPAMKMVPAVWMMSRASAGTSDAWGDRVRPDNQEIGRLAAQYLLDHGHQHIAFFNPNPAQSMYAERELGFRAAAEAAVASAAEGARSVHIFYGQPLRPSEQNSIPAMEAASERFIEKWLATSPRPSGVFIPVDRVTLRAYRHLEQHGIKPGRDVQAVSCDNEQELLSLMDPRPDSIDLNRKAIAQLAVERLFWRMKHRMSAPAVTISVGPVLPGVESRVAERTQSASV
jgi:DNA-binding LacI/PurR family transcriptional regulator